MKQPPMMIYNKRTPLDRRYSLARVRKIFKDIYNLSVVQADIGYKSHRHKPYMLYNVIDSENHLVMEKVTLNALGDYLVSENEY